MAKTNQLAVEIHFVPLPAAEMDEHRERLRTLLLRGVFRFIRQGHPGELPTMEQVSAEPAQE